MKVLMIDDNKMDRVSLKRDLRNTNLVSEIGEEETGVDGINRFKREKFDCILLDYFLPDIKGTEVLKELINIGNEFVTIIAITGTARETIPEIMMEAGASDYLIKDEINTRILERVLRCVLKRKELQEKYIKQIQELKKELEITKEKLEKLM